MYAPLKVTTDYSILKSLIKIDDLIDFLKKNKIEACAICDENLFGAIEFYEKCISNNIKPVIGMTVYLDGWPIYLYAKNYEGYQNMLKVHTLMQKEEVKKDDLFQYKDNIVVILPIESASLYEVLSFYELIYVGYKKREEKEAAELLSDHVIYVNDIRVLEVDDIKYLEYLDKMRKEPKGDYSYNYYNKNFLVDEDVLQEFINLFSFSFPRGKSYMPKYKFDTSSKAFLKALAHKGLLKRMKENIRDEYLKRLDYELEVINLLGFTDYFLIVYDYVLFAKKNGILVGPGRGSAAGSLVSYAIGITEIDPLKYDLLFERFLNKERVTMPDIDIDFDALRREEVIDYVRDKYGKSSVAPGITFNTLKSKLVLREVGKLLNINPNLIDEFVRIIDGAHPLVDNLENEVVKTYLKRYKELSMLYKIALRLEGIKKNISTHAAGVVISSVPLDEVIPICYNNGVMLTGFPMEYLENLGLLKMDFLGLKNLTTIANVLKKIGSDVLKDINLEDKKVYQMLQSGKTDGIFQLETPAMQSLVVQLKPVCFDHLVAAVALGRPGPKDHVPTFIKRKNKEEAVSYIHDDLEPILKNTYGVMLYQEQIIAILSKFAGYSYGEADIIRRAISKKKESILQSGKDEFIRRSIKRGYSKEVAQEIYLQIMKFASYGFNKSHSVSYALIAYQMAYLKVYYPEYFIIELLNMNKGGGEKYWNYLKEKGILFLKPTVNNRIDSYDFIGNKLILPLTLIKKLSGEVSRKILMCQNGGYKDLFDFVLKTKEFMNEEIFDILVHAGAMDNFSYNHQTMVMNKEALFNYASLVEDEENLIYRPEITIYEEYDDTFLRNKELESYGFYITNHPSSRYTTKDVLKTNKMVEMLFKKVSMVVIIESIKVIKTKKGEDMAFFQGSDEMGNADFTVFPKNYESFKEFVVGDLIGVFGEVVKRFDKVSIVVNNFKKMEG